VINDGTKPPEAIEEKPPEKVEEKVEETAMSTIPHADFTMRDLEAVSKFKENGMLGLHAIVDVDVERMMALYMDGKSYRQIAQVLKKDKTIILFLAHKFKWFEIRQDYLAELTATLKDKIVESKLQSQEFLLEVILAYQKKISRNIHQYLRTDSESFVDRIDPKDIGTVLKVMELLHKLNHETLGTPGDKSMVGLNGLGEGVTITKTGANSVEITPKPPSAVSSRLKAFADFKREQERASAAPVRETHDITTEKPLTENGEENESK
jgi:transposase